MRPPKKMIDGWRHLKEYGDQVKIAREFMSLTEEKEIIRASKRINELLRNGGGSEVVVLAVGKFYAKKFADRREIMQQFA